MKLLMDEHIEPAIVRGLQRLIPEVDVITVQAAGLRTQADDLILAWAAKENRVVVSRDVSTMGQEAIERIEKDEAMPGLLLISPNASLGEIIQDLHLIVECVEEGELDSVIDFIPY